MVVGFDLWGTLIESSPLFKQAKRVLYKKYFPKVSANGFDMALERVKKQYDEMAENYGFQPDSELLIKSLLFNLGLDIELEDIGRAFYEDYQELVSIFPPIPIKDSQKIIKQLSPRVDAIHIVSNTMMLKGSTIEPIIEELFPQINKFYFSSTRGYSKPSTKITPSNFSLDYFVGDNPNVDGVYASKIGAKYIQINSNNKTIKDAYNIIINKK